MVNLFDLFRTKPAKKTSLHTLAYGSTGTEVYSGYYNEEYLSKIKDLQGVDLYDKMRRSDGQVKMLLKVVKDPILSASWGVESVDDSDEEKEIAAFIDHALFHDIGYKDGSKTKTFRQFLREALTMIDFGHSVFEIVHKVVMNHPRFGNYIGLSDLSFRSQKTIYEWHVNRNGGLDYIRQISQGDLGVDAKIPAKNLLVLSNDFEGSNYQGISALRPIYGNFFRKEIYRKYQAIGIERSANGVPMGEIDDALRNTNNFAEQFAAFSTMLKRFASNQQNYIVLEKGFKVSDLKLSHDSEKVQKVIEGENIEMTKAFLANFMELGMNNNGGSYSLGSDLSDIFLSNLQTLGEEIADCINKKVVKKLVRAKYGDRDFYPRIYPAGINDKAGKELAEIIKVLSDAGAIKPDERLERHLHKIYKLPEVDREQEENEGKDEKDIPEPEDDIEDDDKEPEKGLDLSVPKKAKNNAKLALKLWKKCQRQTLSSVDIARANEIINSETLSRSTIKRIASFKRNKDHYRPELKEDDGLPTDQTIRWLAWGGG